MGQIQQPIHFNTAGPSIKHMWNVFVGHSTANNLTSYGEQGNLLI